MGDRANVVSLGWPIESEGNRRAVFLYSHWGGTELPETVRKALDSGVGRRRWNDHAYLARIVFDAMQGDSRGEETGFGISTTPPDNQYDFLVLDADSQQVIRVPQSFWAERGHAFRDLDQCDSISFENYVATERTWENLTT